MNCVLQIGTKSQIKGEKNEKEMKKRKYIKRITFLKMSLIFFCLNLSARSPTSGYLKSQAVWRGECLRCQETPEWLFLHTASFPKGWKAGQWGRWLCGDIVMMAKENQQKANQPAHPVSIKIRKYTCIPLGPFNSIILLLRYSGKCSMSIGFWSLKAGDLYDFWSKRFNPFCTMKTVKFFTSHGDIKMLTIHIALSIP